MENSVLDNPRFSMAISAQLQLRDAQQTRGRMLDGILNLLDPLNGQHKPERPGICEAFRRYFSPIASGPLPQGASQPLVIVLIEPP